MPSNKVRVTIFYESLCPACIKFFNEKLEPTVNLIAPYIDVELIPYGHAKVHFIIHLAFTHTFNLKDLESSRESGCCCIQFQNTEFDSNVVFN